MPTTQTRITSEKGNGTKRSLCFEFQCRRPILDWRSRSAPRCFQTGNLRFRYGQNNAPYRVAKKSSPKSALERYCHFNDVATSPLLSRSHPETVPFSSMVFWTILSLACFPILNLQPVLWKRTRASLDGVSIEPVPIGGRCEKKRRCRCR